MTNEDNKDTSINEDINKNNETLITEGKHIEEPKKKKIPKAVKIGILIVLLGISGKYLYDKYSLVYNFNNDSIAKLAKTNKDSGRKFDFFDLEDQRALPENEAGIQKELRHAPYKDSSLKGGQIVYTSSSTGVNLNRITTMYKSGKLHYAINSYGLNTPEDELIDPNQTSQFNQFTSNVITLDSMGSKKLSDAEVDTYAQKAKDIALKKQSPAYYYVGDLIQNLKGKNPTLNSIYYLMLSNRIPAAEIIATEGGTSSYEDYSSYLDTSYNDTFQKTSKILDDPIKYADKESKKSLLWTYNESYEFVNKKVAISHFVGEGAITKYSLDDWNSFQGEYYVGQNEYANGDDVIMLITHYKDISNDMIAEYGIRTANIAVDKENILPGSYSFYKPAYTWCISPKIEEIASAYYDIVEPAVYKGTFTNRNEAMNQTQKNLKDKYTIEQIKSAIMTYEYWALIQ